MDSGATHAETRQTEQKCGCGIRSKGRKEARKRGRGEEEKWREGGRGEGENRRNVLVKHTECQQSGVKTCHSWSLRSLLGDWRGMHWSFMAQNRQCSFAPSTPCTAIVSARTLLRRFLCPFRFSEVSFQDIHPRPPAQSGRSCSPNSCLGSS